MPVYVIRLELGNLTGAKGIRLAPHRITIRVIACKNNYCSARNEMKFALFGLVVKVGKVQAVASTSPLTLHSRLASCATPSAGYTAEQIVLTCLVHQRCMLAYNK
jgi:hypothetical protein